MDLTKYPKRKYTLSETPIEKLENLTKVLGGPNIFMKRDDMLGLTAGGNKTRKLEFLAADALEQGADTLITCGGVQSNHCRLTLAAAVREGLKCQLVLEETDYSLYNPKASGNNLLYHLMGAEKIKVTTAGHDLAEDMQELNEELAREGRKGYMIPVGGSNETGTLGYIACAKEIIGQSGDMAITFDHIITPSGSGGTQAGLVAGFSGSDRGNHVIGINVSRNREEQEHLIRDLLERTFSFLRTDGITKEAIRCYGDYVGPGYAIPTPEMVEAVQLVARTEGILLDPVYTGKAMAGLIDLVRQGHFKRNENVLFIHTGGTPALYEYSSVMLSEEN
ncbi:D-cysteine desulfhydrase [Scopulibacillus darangshiensis]|uniref:D-cysteine desulfhydrase n=1 Tax=Scopulibacillus darangshiensis TaxID=442528 RepID=A0A4R2P479_9BACL|nr:D-cysteine desulfhydrase [Scopulibacillus darangshiensis]TCP29600.1 D-cysteine desulfhydrase [Scopulibacillus darangshiensis]